MDEHAMSAAIAIVLIFAVAIFAFRKIGIWSYFLGAVGLLIGLGELASEQITGKSLSQDFWVYIEQYPLKGWLLIAFLGLVCCIWLLHLAWKQIRRKS